MMINDLMTISADVRRRAIAEHLAHAGRPTDDGVITPARRMPYVGRIEPCPCASGRKFKLCCGAT